MILKFPSYSGLNSDLQNICPPGTCDCDHIGNRVFAYVMKDLEWKAYRIGRGRGMLNLTTSPPEEKRREEERRELRGEGQVNLEAKIRSVQLQAKEHHEFPEAIQRGGPKREDLEEPSEKNITANPSFQIHRLQNCGKRTNFCFNKLPPSYCQFVAATPENK